VFGLSHVGETTGFTVWVPLETGESVVGARWYNCDGEVVFPKLSAVAGAAGHPELMVHAAPVALGVYGAEMAWSEVTFTQPVSSATSGLYLIFQLPNGSDFAFAGNGGGTGFGYVVGSGEKGCWTTADGETWFPFSGDYQVAIEPVRASNKSANVLVLEQPSKPDAVDERSESEVTPKAEFSLTAAPNPFNPQTELRFNIPAAGPVILEVFDLRGRRVRTLINRHSEAGLQTYMWDGKDARGARVASGVYSARLKTGQRTLTTRLVLVQ